jgi:Tfp pilus assembly protein PilV
MNQAAMLRSVAMEHAYAMLDKMRSNVVAANAGAYNKDFNTPIPTGATTAETDVRTWDTQLKVALPNPLTQICRRTNANAGVTGCGATGDFFVVKVQWTQGAGAASLLPGDGNYQYVEVVGQLQ